MMKAYRRAMALGVGSSVALGIVAACVGDDPQSTPPGSDGGNSNVDAISSSGDDGKAPGTDSGGPGSSASCSDTTLKKVDGTTEECAFGCVATPSPHCGAIHPSGTAITADMLSTPGILAKTFTLAGPTKFDTDTGEIEGTRAPNGDPLTLQVKDGIGFKVADLDATHHIAIWVFDSLEIAAGAAVRFTSTNAAAFVVAKTAQINGVIDLRGYSGDNKLCTPTVFQQAMAGGPGGNPGSISGKQGGGPGGGYRAENPASSYPPGPGGAGYGGLGGRGGAKDGGSQGATNSGNGGDGGSIYGDPTLIPLLGGSGGAGVSSYSGGGGGGAFHLVAGQSVTIGDGTANGGINAGGCPGVNADMGSASGGGGSGGAVLIETPLLELKPNSGIAANGGTGGPGFAGKLENTMTQAFATGSQYGSPGSGGGGKSPNGQDGFAMPPNGYSGGAGGGAVGRIRINTRTGNLNPPVTAILSPAVDAPGSPTTIGKLDVR